MPPNEATEIVASPEPQMAVMRRRAYGATTPGLAITIGATTGPGLGKALSGLSFGAGGLGLASGAFLDTAAGDAAAGGGTGGSLRNFSGNSEMMECLSETFAFN